MSDNVFKEPFKLEMGMKHADATKKKFFIGSSAGAQYNRKLSRKEIFPYPGISSYDRTYHRFQRSVYEDIASNTDLQKSVNENSLFSSNAISGDFSHLLTMGGYPMTPATYAVIDNTLLRDELGLARDFVNQRHIDIFDRLMELRYADRLDTNAKLSRVSSSGFPFFSNDVGFKAEHLSYILENGDDFLGKFGRREFSAIYDKYQVLWSIFDVYRLQNDMNIIVNGQFKTKERLVNDYEFARTGGASGRRFPADKNVYLNGALLDWISANRARTANGFNIALNASCSCGFEPFRSYADVTYSFTYKHTTREKILEKIKKFKYYIPLDVTQYDQTVAKFMFERWVEKSPFNDAGKDVVRTMFNSPMFYRGVSEDSNPLWTGDPLDYSYYNQFRGLPSGAFCTSAMGKDFFSWAMLCCFDDLTNNVLESMEDILLGQHEHWGLLNQGDDTIVLCNSTIFRKYVDNCTESGTSISPYFKVDIEDGLRFLGNVGYENENGELQLCGDMMSFLGNGMIPERSIDSPMKPYGVYGAILRREVYADNPSFTAVDEIFQRNFRKSFGLNWFDYMSEHMVMPKVEANVSILSQADLEVIDDPSKRFYKYDEKDLSPHVLDIIEEKVSDRNMELAYNLLIKKR